MHVKKNGDMDFTVLSGGFHGESMTHFKDKANLIWGVANLLRGDYRQSGYGKAILPMRVLEN